ncbi:hypothetical protein [Campylobacter troglodytis]|nr:hypothetical protein [Campylobacter troglodytis]
MLQIKLSMLNTTQIPQSQLNKEAFIFDSNELLALKAKIEKSARP